MTVGFWFVGILWLRALGVGQVALAHIDALKQTIQSQAQQLRDNQLEMSQIQSTAHSKLTAAQRCGIYWHAAPGNTKSLHVSG